MPGPRVRAAVAVAFFTYVLLIRTHDITSTFLLLGEQMRDWTVALGSWHDLPLTGTPSTAGGRGFGPIYYWLLWFGRHVFGPFTDHLPHAGGITVAVLQSVADIWLLVALSRQVPFFLALAVALAIATGPFDVGISSVIWNPPVATALVKMTMALVLCLGESPSLWRIAATAAMAWLSVQAHSSAIFVAGPVLAALVIQPLLRHAPQRAIEAARVVAEVIVLLQLPYIVAQFRTPAGASGPTVVFDSLAHAATVSVGASVSHVVNITTWLLFHTDDSWVYGLLTGMAWVVVAWRWRRDAGLLAISVVPLVAATALFSTWTRAYDSYWFLTLAPAMALMFGLAVAAIPRAGVVEKISMGLLAGIVYLQPSHIEVSAQFFKYPQYRALLDGSRAARRRAPVLRDLRVAFEVHPTTDVQYLYRVLGGRVGDDGAHVAVIQPDGTVIFSPVP